MPRKKKEKKKEEPKADVYLAPYTAVSDFGEFEGMCIWKASAPAWKAIRDCKVKRIFPGYRENYNSERFLPAEIAPVIIAVLRLNGFTVEVKE